MFCPRSVARQKETKGANQSMVIGNISVVKCAKKARKGLETPLANQPIALVPQYSPGQFQGHLVLK